MPTLTRTCPTCHHPVPIGATCNPCHDRHRPTTPQRGYDRQWQTLVTLVLERDHHTCHWCGGPATTGDHLTPLAHGGARLDPVNVAAACRPCNSRRGAITRRETRQ